MPPYIESKWQEECSEPILAYSINAPPSLSLGAVNSVIFNATIEKTAREYQFGTYVHDPSALTRLRWPYGLKTVTWLWCQSTKRSLRSPNRHWRWITIHPSISAVIIKSIVNSEYHFNIQCRQCQLRAPPMISISSSYAVVEMGVYGHQCYGTPNSSSTCGVVAVVDEENALGSRGTA